MTGKLFLLVLLIVFCFPSMAISGDLVTTKIVTTQESNEAVQENKDLISKTMQVENPMLELSSDCRILDDVAYWTLTGIYKYSAENFWKDIQVLKSMGIKKIVVYINCGGGDIFAGMDLADQVRVAKDEGFYIEMHARGIVASATVPVFLMGSKKYSSHNTMFMTHKAGIGKMFAYEDIDDLAQQKIMLEKWTDRYIKMIVENSDLEYNQVEGMISKTTWFFADEAKEYGMVDELE